jgi:hypothetical protein
MTQVSKAYGHAVIAIIAEESLATAKAFGHAAIELGIGPAVISTTVVTEDVIVNIDTVISAQNVSIYDTISVDEVGTSEVEDALPDDVVEISVVSSVTVDAVFVTVTISELDVAVSDVVILDTYSLITLGEVSTGIVSVTGSVVVTDVCEAFIDGSAFASDLVLLSESLFASIEFDSLTVDSVIVTSSCAVELTVGLSTGSTVTVIDIVPFPVIDLSVSTVGSSTVNDSPSVTLVHTVSVTEEVTLSDVLSPTAVSDPEVDIADIVVVTGSPVLVLETYEDGGWDEDDDTPAGTNLRYIIPAAKFKQSGNYVQVELAYKGEVWSFSSLFIGHVAVEGDAYDFDGGQVRVTFGGLSGATVNSTGFKSDWVLFDLDKARNACFAFYFTSTEPTPRKAGVDLYDCYSKEAIDETSIADVSGYSAVLNRNNSRLISKINVASVAIDLNVLPSVVDSSAVQDVPLLDSEAEALGLLVFDAINLTTGENAHSELPLFCSDSVVLADDVSGSFFVHPSVSVFSTVLVEDEVQIHFPELTAGVEDIVGVSEDVIAVEGDLDCSTTDEVTANEFSRFVFSSFFQVADSLIVDDSADVVLAFLVVDVVETVRLNETSIFAPDYLIAVFNTIYPTDSISTDIGAIGYVVDEIVSLTEEATVELGTPGPIYLTISDNVNTVDTAVSSSSTLLISKDDIFSVTDSVSVVAVTARGLVSVTTDSHVVVIIASELYYVTESNGYCAQILSDGLAYNTESTSYCVQIDAEV